MPRGQAEAPFARTWNWTEDVSTVASTGRYFHDGTAMWSAFTGERVIYQALATSWAGQVEVSIDGITRGVVSLVNSTTAIRTFAYTNLGNGPHVLQVRVASGCATVDTFITSQSVIRYTYDPLSRLTGATYSGDYTHTFAYAYDAVGNRTAQTQTITSTVVTTYTYDAANQLVTAKASNDATVWYYTSDANGNLREMTPNGTNPANGAIRYSYDAANQLNKVETHNGSAYSVLAQMAYDGLGNRARLVGWVSGVPYTTTYATRIVGQVQILQAGSGGITTTYWYGIGSIGEFGSSTSYYLVDGNGSVRQAVDQNANVVFARWYDPFGQMLNQNGTGDTLYGYLGGQFDQVIGLMYIDGRYYDPITGRFLSPSTGGQNPYVPFASLSLAPFLIVAVLRRRKKGQIWTGWLVLAVMASVGLGIAACGGQPAPSQPQVIPNPPSVPTTPSTSMPVPIPSSTPVPPTATPLPTPTSTCTPTSTPTLTGYDTPILDVPWTSEKTIWGTYPQACGPTALWMLLAFHLGRSSVLLLPEEENPDQPDNKSVITRLREIPPQEGGYDPRDRTCSGANQACTSPGALVKVAGQYGLAINHHEKWTIEQLAESLRANKPVLVSNRVLLASGAPSHYFVVVGIVGDDVFYNDSYTLSETEGKQKRGKLKDLMTAWSTNIDQDKDPTNEAGWNGWGMAVQ